MNIKRSVLPDTIRRLALITAGAFLFAAGVGGFCVPHRLLSTGVNGISMLISYLTGFPIWLPVALINIPIFISGYIFVSRRFFWFSLFGMAVMTVFLWLTESWDFGVNNPILAAGAGGALCGTGAGLVLRQGGSKGGVDVIAAIINRFTPLSFGVISNTVNFGIAAAMMFIFGLEEALLTLCSIYILNRVADAVISGFSSTVTVLVLSRKQNNIVGLTAKELGRRASVLQNIEDRERPKETLMFIIQPRELSRLKDIIFREDRDAEVMMINTKEVRARGFERKGLF